jgi:hypothetical protein
MFGNPGISAIGAARIDGGAVVAQNLAKFDE